MSETIDEIEDVLLRKKHQIQGKIDVNMRIRENPLQAAGIVLGAGLLLGFLTGGDDRAQEREEREEAIQRASLWEARARRLLAIAREQEADLEELELAVCEFAEEAERADRAALAISSEDDPDLVEDTWDDDSAEWDSLRIRLAERIGRVVTSTGRALVDRLVASR